MLEQNADKPKLHFNQKYYYQSYVGRSGVRYGCYRSSSGCTGAAKIENGQVRGTVSHISECAVVETCIF